MNENIEIEYYLNIINDTFTVIPRSDRNYSLGNFTVPKSNGDSIRDDKEKYMDQWKDLMQASHEKGYWIRNLEPTGMFHSFTCQITCEVDSILLGAIVGISPLFRRYGFYFSRFEPIPGTSNFKEIMSYYPEKSKQLEIKEVTEKLVNRLFPEMEYFDNRLASYTPDFTVYEFSKLDFDLWEIIFDEKRGIF